MNRITTCVVPGAVQISNLVMPLLPGRNPPPSAGFARRHGKQSLLARTLFRLRCRLLANGLAVDRAERGCLACRLKAAAAEGMVWREFCVAARE